MISDLSWIDYALWSVFALIVAAIFIVDALSYRIPNKLVAALALIGLVVVVRQWGSGAGLHLLTAGLALGAGYLLYQFTQFGAGDAKFIAAIFLWLGPAGVLPFLFWFGVSCAGLCIILLAGRRLNPFLVAPIRQWRPIQKDAPVPLALAISPAALCAAYSVVLS